MHGYISGSFLRVILLISHSHGGQEVHQNYINGFSKKKKSHSGQLSHFRPKNDAPSKILDNERSQELHENYINGFSENIFLWGKCTILGPKIMCRV